MAHGIVLVVAGQHSDRAVERRGEQQRLALARCEIEQPADLRKEAHVGHAVGLVDDDHFDGVETERVLPNEVGQTTGAGDEHVDTAVEAAALRLVAHPAVDGEDATGTRCGERLEGTADLCRELTGGRQDQRGRAPLVRTRDACQQRHAERDRLSGACRRAAADVTARDRVGDGRGLDLEGLMDTARCERGDEIAGHAEIGECVGHEGSSPAMAGR